MFLQARVAEQPVPVAELADHARPQSVEFIKRVVERQGEAFWIAGQRAGGPLKCQELEVEPALRAGPRGCSGQEIPDVEGHVVVFWLRQTVLPVVYPKGDGAAAG